MDKIFIETVYFGIVISLLTYWVATKIRKKFPYPIFNPLSHQARKGSPGKDGLPCLYGGGKERLSGRPQLFKDIQEADRSDADRIQKAVLTPGAALKGYDRSGLV